jgi:hypothetical protein
MKKTIWIPLVLIIPIGFMGALSLTFFWFLNSPKTLTTLMEWGLSNLTNTQATIGQVAILEQPFRIKLKHLRFSFDPKLPESTIDIDAIDLQLSFSGPLGRKTLWIESLRINALKARLNSDVQLPKFLSSSASNDSAPGLFGTILATLTFKEVRLKSLEGINGHVIYYSKHKQVELSKIALRFDHALFEKRPFLKGSAITSLFDAQNDLELPKGLLDFTMIFTPFENKGTVAGEINLTADNSSVKGAKITDINAHMRFDYDQAKKHLKIKAFNLDSMVGTFPNESVQAILPCSVKVQAGAEINFNRRQLYQTKWQVEVDHLGFIKGLMAGQWKENIQYDIHILQSWFSLKKLSPLFAKAILGESSQFDVEGNVALKGEVTLRPDGAQYQSSGKIILGLHQNRYTFKSKDTFLTGSLGGILEVSGTWPGSIEYVGRVESPATDVLSPKLKLRSANTRCQFQGRYPELLFKELIFRVPSMKLALSKAFDFKNIKIQADNAGWNFKSFCGRIPTLQIGSDSLKSVVFGINYTPLTTKINIHANQSNLIKTLQKMELLPKDWEVSAKEVLQANLVYDAKRDVMDWQAWFNLEELMFESNDQAVMADNLEPTLKANGKLGFDNFTVSGQVALDCGVGEILLDRLYTNFEEHPFHLAANVNYLPAAKKVEINQGRLRLDELMKAVFSFKQNRLNDQSNKTFHIAIPATAITPLYNFAVKEPFELDIPALATTKITGTFKGNLDLALEEDQWEIKGDWHFEKGSVVLAEKKIKFSGIRMNLPVWMTSRHLSSGKESPLKGALMLKSMQVPFLAAQPLKLPLTIRPNTILIPKKTSFKAQSGGLIHLWPLTMNLGISKGFRLDTRIDLDNFRFDAGLKRWWPSQGPMIINANLDPVWIEGQTLYSRGSLLTHLFGGDFKISKLNVMGLFSSTPVFGMDIMVDGVDLADLTDQTNFGKIDGVLKGRIENFEIANNQPQQFNLRLETVPHRGIPQKISVKAVESIARIGGGQSPFMGLAGKFATLFRKFGYRKIGMVASLKNDLFSINGLVHEKGQEYLVKKSGLSGVDVVNSNPDNRIGFKDMVKRIQRVLNPHAKPVVQ